MLSSAVLPLALLFFGMIALIIAHLATRRSRLQIARRINLVAGQRAKAAADTFGASLKALSKRFDEQVRGVLAFGASSSWGMQTGAIVLIPLAATSASIAWFLVSITMGFSAWLAAPLAAIASLLGPRSFLMREQKRSEHQFTELFPDVLDTTVRMLRAGRPEG